MRSNVNMAAFAVALVSLVISLYLLAKKEKATDRPVAEGASAAADSGHGDLEALERSIEELGREFAEIRAVLGSPGPGADDGGGANDGSAEIAPVSQRLQQVEASLARLQSSFDGISLEGASAERDALFRGPEGYLKADEYFAAGKFAIAGEGYLAFLEEHPDHPDAYNVLENARNAFKKAGYMDKAIWAQEELISNRAEGVLPKDLITLANLEKEAGNYDAAIKHTEAAAEMYGPGSDRLWQRLYSAWYHRLRDGNEAGLEKYREVQREIERAGYSEDKLGDRVREKIAEIERIQATGR